ARRWLAGANREVVSDALPIRITRVCRHALIANRAAMFAAGIRAPAAVPQVAAATSTPGGPDDTARWICTEDAMTAIHRAVPAPGPDEWLAAAEWACDAAAAAGFTGIHCLIANRDELNALARL